MRGRGSLLVAAVVPLMLIALGRRLVRPLSLRMPLLYPTSTSAPSSFAREKAVAISAVLQASDVAAQVYKQLVNEETVTKKDKSPVTGPSPLARDASSC